MTRLSSYRSIECLEQKRLNAADLIGGMLAASPAISNTAQTAGASPGSVNTSAAAAVAGQNVAGTEHFTAALSGTGHGSVNLVSGTAHGSPRANLVVHVSGAAANQMFEVSIDGNVVRSISTNARGHGILHLNSALHNADKLLEALPTLAADANVSVGVSGETPILTGALHAKANVSGSVADATVALTGTVQAASKLENVVIPRLNSVIDKLDSSADHAIDSLVGVTDKLDNVVHRLLGTAENLTAKAVDKLFGDADESNIRDLVHGLVRLV